MKLPDTLLEEKHLPVMINEVLEICDPKNGGNFMDCTFGAGGYSKEFLKFQKVKVVALDRDNSVIEIANKLKNKFKSSFIFYNKKFSKLDLVSVEKFDAVIFDLGLSSIQLDDLSRGFSFKSKNELNMSMGQTERTAKEVLNNYNSQDLKDIIKIFGDEEEASKIAKNVIKERANNQINTTDELVKIIKKSKKKIIKKKLTKAQKLFKPFEFLLIKKYLSL